MQRAPPRSCVIVGAGLAGLAAAVTAAEFGLRPIVLEKDAKIGGAAAFSGGQVWVGANHVAEREGLQDSVQDTLDYVHASAHRDPASLDEAMAREWVQSGREAARWFEERGVISWEIIPGYADYHFPALPGSRPEGRYLTGARFDGNSLGAARDRLHVGPDFPVGITYPEMFTWGGMSSRTGWDVQLAAQRRREDQLTFGAGVVAAFLAAALRRGVSILTERAVVELLLDADGAASGVRCSSVGSQPETFEGTVVLATGSHDWSPKLTERFTGIPPEDGGSLAPQGVSGDAIGLVQRCGGAVTALPAWAAPAIPGYLLPGPLAEGDTGFRACYEQSRPHTFLVNRRGERFCDDSFHSAIVAAALTSNDDGELPNFPFFMIWDEQHHRKYGLGQTPPGGEYPAGLLASAATVSELAQRLSLPVEALEHTVADFNEHARLGADPRFGRGSNAAVRSWRGDAAQQPNPCIGPLEEPPFHGMRMRLLNTGIAAAGVLTGTHGRVLREDRTIVPRLYAIGEAAARTTGGVGYNSGYSLGRAITYGCLAAREIAGVSSWGSSRSHIGGRRPL